VGHFDDQFNGLTCVTQLGVKALSVEWLAASKSLPREEDHTKQFERHGSEQFERNVAWERMRSPFILVFIIPLIPTTRNVWNHYLNHCNHERKS
jgi:hypothetical protein